MIGLNPGLMWAVHRVRTTFVDDLGNPRSGVGTGFWMQTDAGINVFVTNRHNVDPSLKFSKESDLRLAAVSIELRRYNHASAPTTETEFFEVADFADSLRAAESADCAVLVNPTLRGFDRSLFPTTAMLRLSDAADEKAFSQGRIGPMEEAVFIGFPGSAGKHWWDEKWKLPVARRCTIASLPSIPFTNSQVTTADVVLVSGLSFAGASGSPVFLPARGFPPGGVLVDPTWRPAMLIGIMSGHFWDERATPTMFHHTGLSYLTRVTSILQLLHGVAR